MIKKDETLIHMLELSWKQHKKMRGWQNRQNSHHSRKDVTSDKMFIFYFSQVWDDVLHGSHFPNVSSSNYEFFR